MSEIAFLHHLARRFRIVSSQLPVEHRAIASEFLSLADRLEGSITEAEDERALVSEDE
jgi:hypothetical protein